MIQILGWFITFSNVLCFKLSLNRIIPEDSRFMNHKQICDVDYKLCTGIYKIKFNFTQDFQSKKKFLEDYVNKHTNNTIDPNDLIDISYINYNEKNSFWTVNEIVDHLNTNSLSEIKTTKHKQFAIFINGLHEESINFYLNFPLCIYTHKYITLSKLQEALSQETKILFKKLDRVKLYHF